MKKLILFFVVVLQFYSARSQNYEVDQSQIEEDLNKIIEDLSKYYAYLHEKEVDFNCLKVHYLQNIPNIKSEEETVLFFEYLLDEF